MNDQPSIYVACLESYNSGYLYGTWINATQDVADIYAEIQTMLANSPIDNAEEWAIQDYECFEGLRIDEYAGIETVKQYALFIEEHGKLGAAVFAYCGDIDHALETLENYYHGEWDSELDYATDLFDECYLHDLPAYIQGYIDYKSFSRDLFMGDYFSIRVDHKTHVFSCH